MTDATILHEYRCLECGYAWRSHNPEVAHCSDCESRGIVTLHQKFSKG